MKHPDTNLRIGYNFTIEGEKWGQFWETNSETLTPHNVKDIVSLFHGMLLKAIDKNNLWAGQQREIKGEIKA